MVDDAISRFSMGSTTHLEEEKKELAKDVHRLVRLGVRIMDSAREKKLVKNVIESSLVLELKQKKYKDSVLH